MKLLNQLACVTIVVTLIAGGWAQASAAEDGTLTGTLVWGNGDSLPGRLLGAKGNELQWQTSLFQQPLRLQSQYLQTVDFLHEQGSEEAKDAFRITLANGDVCYGTLIDVSDNHMSFTSERYGDLKLNRDSIRSLRRMDNPSLVYLGPNGLSGWKSLKTQTGQPWTANAEGHLTCRKSRCDIYRQLDLPNQVEVELTIKATDKLRFLFGFDDQPSKSVRLETWDDELVALSGDDFEPILTIPKDMRMLELRLYWNRDAGDLTVYDKAGKKIGEMKAAKPAAGKAGIYLQNKSSNITLQGLRISKWNGQAPLPVKEGVNRIHLVNGDIIYGKLTTLDAETQKIKLTGETPTAVSIDEVDSIYVADTDSAEAQPNSATQVQAMFYDGALLTGELVEISDGNISLATAYSDNPLHANLTGARKLAFQPQDKPAQDGFDKLYCEGGILRGTLVGGKSKEAAILWQPFGGVNASPLAAGCQARFVRATRENEEGGIDPIAFGDLLFLTSRDIVPCRIESIDEEFVHLRMAFAEADKIRHDQIQAIELSSDGRVQQSGFTDSGWQKLPTKEDAVEIDDEKVTFSGRSTVGHRTILRGDDIRFHMKWKRNTTAFLTVRLFAGDIKRPGKSLDLGMYCTREQIWVTDANSGRFAFNQNSMAQVELGRAQVRITNKANQIKVYINDKQTYSTSVPESRRGGNGIVFTTASSGMMGAQINSELTISNFEVLGGNGIMAQRYVDEEAKQQALTVPRFRRENPFTHMLLARNGDMLRGRLLAVSDQHLLFQSRLDEFKFSRARVAAIVWLHPKKNGETSSDLAANKPNAGNAEDEGVNDDEQPNESPATPEESPQENQTVKAGPSVRVLLGTGEIVVVTPDSMTELSLIGQSDTLGECTVPVASIRELHVGGYGELDPDLGYADWKPTAAAEPKFAGGPGGGTSPGIPGSEHLGTIAKDFKLPTLDGKQFVLSEHKDKIVVLDFWATWCGPCVRAMPNYLRVLENHPRDKVLFVGINQGEQADAVKPFLAERGWKMDVALDADSLIARQFGVEGIPHTVVIGKDNKVQWVHVGYSPGAENELGDVVNQLLDGKDIPLPQNELAAPDSPMIGRAAPEFAIKTLDGKDFKLSDQQGKILVLDFWATWCGPCVRAMPQYLAALEGFKAEDVRFVAVNEEEKNDAVSQFVKDRKWKLDVAMDSDGKVASAFDVEAIPHTVLVDKKGVVRWVHTGFSPEAAQKLKEQIQTLLQEG